MFQIGVVEAEHRPMQGGIGPQVIGDRFIVGFVDVQVVIRFDESTRAVPGERVDVVARPRVDRGDV